MRKFHRHVPTQLAACLLFQLSMIVIFQFAHYSLLGAYILPYLYCVVWGNVGYVLLSDALFCLVTVWLCGAESYGIAVDLCFWYLLFTLVPCLLIVEFRNALIRRLKRSEKNTLGS